MVEITTVVERLPTGKYSAVITTPEGITCCDGGTVESVVRSISIAVVDALEECLDLRVLADFDED